MDGCSESSKHKAKDGFANERQQEKKEFFVELTEVFMFCGFYSSLVIFSLWITIADRFNQAESGFAKK
jgi:hypothetical protein